MEGAALKITFKHTYDFVCGIGHFCGTATYLRRHCLRRASGPLDWNGEAPSGLVGQAELIRNDFKSFLKFENLTKLDHPEGEHDDMKNDYYRDEATGILLYHDFQAGVPLAETYPKARATYDRRIARFYRMVADSRHTLLVYHTRFEHLTDEKVMAALRILREKLGEKVDVLVIENVDGMEKVDAREPMPGAFYVRGFFNKWDIDWLIGDYPQLDKIYGSIPCRGKFSRRIGKLVAKITTSLHFSKEARRAARASLRGALS